MVEIKEDVQQKNAWLEQRQCRCNCKQSVGEKKLKYVQPPIRPSYAPVKMYKPPEAKMSDSSTYKLSFEAFDQKLLRQCRGTPMMAKENIIPAGEFSGFTTNRMSYGSWIGIPKEKLIYPKDHNLNGEGPMSSMTTNRHDFQAKRIASINKFVPKPNLGLSTSRMDGNTTNMLSYQCPDFATFDFPVSYKPQSRYLPPSSPLDGNTVNKLSYLPWQPHEKEELPWAKKCPYVSPSVPLDTNTIYNGSFIAPGVVVEDATGHCEGCECLIPSECGGMGEST